MTSRHWHAWIADGSHVVRAVNVVADTARAAAVEAARATGAAGQWVVINGEPVTVEVTEQTQYVAAPNGSNGTNEEKHDV
jgi:hypothetical protein